MRAALLLPLLLLAACGSHRDDAGLPADDQRALNEAAAGLDANDATPAAPSDQGNSQ